jgi:hypothetical protein
MWGETLLQINKENNEKETLLKTENEDLQIDIKDAQELNKIFVQAKNNNQNNNINTITQNVDSQIEWGKLSPYIEEIALGVVLYLDNNYEKLLDNPEDGKQTLQEFRNLFNNILKYYSNENFKKIEIKKFNDYTLTHSNITMLTEWNDIKKYMNSIESEIDKKLQIQEQESQYKKNAILARKNFLENLNEGNITKADAEMLFEQNQLAFDGLFATNADFTQNTKVQKLVTTYLEGTDIDIKSLTITTTKENDLYYLPGVHVIRVDIKNTTPKKQAEITFGPDQGNIYRLRAQKFAKDIEEVNKYKTLEEFKNYIGQKKEITQEDAVFIFEKNENVYNELLGSGRNTNQDMIKKLVKVYKAIKSPIEINKSGKSIEIEYKTSIETWETTKDTITFNTLKKLKTKWAEVFFDKDLTPNELLTQIDEVGNYEAFTIMVDQQANPTTYLTNLIRWGLIDSISKHANYDDFEKNQFRSTLANLVAKYETNNSNSELINAYLSKIGPDIQTEYLGNDITSKISNYNKIAEIIDDQPRSQQYRNIMQNKSISEDMRNQMLESLKNNNSVTTVQRNIMQNLYSLKKQLQAHEAPKSATSTVKAGIEGLWNKRGGAITQLVDLFGGKWAFMKRLTKNFPAVSDAFLKKFKESYELKDKQLEDFTKLNDALPKEIDNETGEWTANEIIDEYKKNNGIIDTLEKNISTINPILLYNLAIAYNKKEENTKKLPVDEIFEFNGNRQAVGLQENKTTYHKDLINLIINSNDTWKTIKNAHSELAGLNNYTYHTDDAGNERKLNYNNKRIASYADVSQYLSAYLITGGQKKLTHVIGESESGELIKVGQENTKETPQKTLENIEKRLEYHKTTYQTITDEKHADYGTFKTQIIDNLAPMLEWETNSKKTGYSELCNKLSNQTSEIKNLFTNPKTLIQLLTESKIIAYKETLIPDLQKAQSVEIKVENDQIKIKKPNTNNEYRII